MLIEPDAKWVHLLQARYFRNKDPLILNKLSSKVTWSRDHNRIPNYPATSIQHLCNNTSNKDMVVAELIEFPEHGIYRNFSKSPNNIKSIKYTESQMMKRQTTMESLPPSRYTKKWLTVRIIKYRLTVKLSMKKNGSNSDHSHLSAPFLS